MSKKFGLISNGSRNIFIKGGSLYDVKGIINLSRKQRHNDENIVIYGEKSVGKTTLIKTFIGELKDSNKIIIDFSGEYHNIEGNNFIVGKDSLKDLSTYIYNDKTTVISFKEKKVTKLLKVLGIIIDFGLDKNKDIEYSTLIIDNIDLVITKKGELSYYLNNIYFTSTNRKINVILGMKNHNNIKVLKQYIEDGDNFIDLS